MRSNLQMLRHTELCKPSSQTAIIRLTDLDSHCLSLQEHKWDILKNLPAGTKRKHFAVKFWRFVNGRGKLHAHLVQALNIIWQKHLSFSRDLQLKKKFSIALANASFFIINSLVHSFVKYVCIYVCM